MSLLDVIGFIFAMVALFFMFMKRVAEEKRRSALPEEKGQTLDEFLLSQDHDDNLLHETPYETSHAEKAKKLKSLAQQSYQVSKSQSDKNKKMAASKPYQENYVPPVYKRADSYEVIQRETSSRGHSLIKKMRNPQEMFVLKEILDKPLALRRQEREI